MNIINNKQRLREKAFDALVKIAKSTINSYFKKFLSFNDSPFQGASIGIDDHGNFRHELVKLDSTSSLIFIFVEVNRAKLELSFKSSSFILADGTTELDELRGIDGKQFREGINSYRIVTFGHGLRRPVCNLPRFLALFYVLFYKPRYGLPYKINPIVAFFSLKKAKEDLRKEVKHDIHHLLNPYLCGEFYPPTVVTRDGTIVILPTPVKYSIAFKTGN